MPEIRNPNLQTQGPGGGSGGGDMRSTIAFTLVILVALLGYQYFFKPAPPPAPTQQPQSQATQPAGQQTGQQAGQETAPGQAQPSAAGAKSSATAPAITPSIGATSESDITVENEVYKIVFTNRGARVKQWILKKYVDTAGKPLDMVQPQASELFGYPLSLFTYEPQLTAQLNNALYQTTVEGAQPSSTGLVVAPNTVTYHFAGNGLDVVKTFKFDSSYVVDVETEVKRNGTPVRALVEWPAGLGDMEEFLPSSLTRSQVRTSASAQFAWSLDGKDDSMAAKKVSNNATLEQPYSYAAVMDLYFAAAFLPVNPAGTTVVTLHNSIDLPSNLSDPNSQKSPADVIGLAVGNMSGDTHLRLFAGPKATDILASIHTIGPDGKPTSESLGPLIQFGWMTVIAKPLYIVLRFMVEHGIGNWGWAIIIFTVVFSLVLLPTRFMMMKSSLKMMRIQPKVRRHQAALRPSQGQRPQAVGDERRDDGALQGRGREHVRRLPAAALADAAVLRLLPRAAERGGAAPGALVLAHRPVEPGPAAHSADSDHPHHVPDAVHHAVAGHGPRPAAHDGLHDAGRLRIHAVALRVGTGALLGHQQRDQPGHTGGINQSKLGREMHEIAAKRPAKKTGGSERRLFREKIVRLHQGPTPPRRSLSGVYSLRGEKS